MKFKKPLFLLAATTLFVGVSCQKDSQIENLDTGNVKNKLSKATYAKASAQYGNSFADSVNNLLQEFSLTQVNQPIDKTTDIVQEFKDVASAREFLDNLTKSSIVDDGNHLPKATEDGSDSSSDVNIAKKATDQPKKKAYYNAFADVLQFQFYIPSRRFVFLNWSWNSPVGFVIQGYVNATEPIRYWGQGVRFDKFDVGEFNVYLYGPHAFTTYDKGYTYIEHIPRSYLATFNWAGNVSLVVMIKDLGTLYSFPVRGRIVADMGPYPVDSFSGYVDGSPQYTKMQAFYVTK